MTKADNNQGGVATFEYETIASVFPGQPTYAKHYKNNRRVTKRLFEDGRGNTYAWTYEYKDPAYNSLGTILTTSGSSAESGPNAYPSSATVYYNEKRDPNDLDTSRPLLVHKRNTEFRGHSYVKETDPNGNQTEHWFYQGNLGMQGDQGCYPKDASNNPLTGDAILSEATCFVPMRDREFLKGREWKTIRHQGTAGANINLARGKVASQSSTAGSNTAGKAVDGITDGNYNNGSVTHTNLDAQAWWQVDLGAINSIGNIDVWNRTDCCSDRLSNFDVFVSDVPFVSSNINETRNQAGVSSYYTPGVVGTSIRLTINRTGRYVRVQLRGTNYLSLAEVQVWSGSTALSETQHEFTVNFYEYGDTTQEKLTGLWHAFAFEIRTTENAWELGSTALTRKTEFAYDIANNPHYGNLLSTKEYNEGGTVTRETTYAYKVLSNTTSYIVDRKRSEDIKDGSGNRVARTVFAYDGSNGGNESLTKGDLTLVRKYHNMPPTLPGTPATIESSDTSFGYDAAGNKTSSTTYAGYGTALTNDTGWSPPGNGSAARTKTTQYDPTFNVFPVRITENIPSLVELRDYDYRMGTQTSETDYNNVPTLARYDVFGRITAVIKPGDSVNMPTASADYHDWEKPVRYIMAEREISGNEPYWRPTIFLYDGLGREIQNKKESVDGYEHIVEDKRYDGLGQVIEQSQLRYVNTSGTFWDFVPPTNPLYRPTRNTYDGMGRKTQVQEPGPTATTPITTLTQHSVSGNRKVVTTTDPNRHITKHESDVLGRLLAVKEHTGNAGTEGAYTLYATTSYDYSPLDLLKEVTDTKGKKITMQYDTLGRKKAMTDLAMGAWTYTYDPNGNLKTQTDAKNQTITFGYDAMDRLISKTYPGATTPERTAYTYDVGTNGKGRRTKMERFAATSGTLLASTAWQYDARGRKIRADHTVDGLADARRFDWTYDAADRITSITYPLVPTLNSREVVSYGYDAAWRSISLCSNLYSPCYVTNTKYSPLDQPQEVRLGNSLWNAYIYNDPTQRLQQIKVGPNGDGSIFNRTYTYDDASNVKSIARNDGGATETQNFTYDHRDRLKTWIIPGAQQVVEETYTYDEVGNLLTKAKKKNANQSDTYTYIYNYNRTAGAGGPYGVLDVQLNGGNNTDYTYDANGNLSATDGPDPGERRNYTWNADNQPTLITRQGGGCGVTETYVYDAEGERVKQTRGNNENTYDLEGMWWEKRHSNGAIIIREMYKFNGQVVAQREVQPNRNVPANGLRADYYNNANETNFQVTKYDGQISFNWGTGSPDPTVSCDRFSIVWNGNVTPNETGTYTFNTRSDDGVRLWVNDQLIIDNWTVHPPTDNSAQIALTAGVAYPIKLEYYEEAGGAEISLMWLSQSSQNLGMAPESIPQAQLSPPQADLNQPTLSNTLTYLHSDHLGSISVVTDNTPSSPSNYNPRRQEFDPWGLVRNPPGRPINDTTLNYTGQQLDGTNLLYYHARYYDPLLSRFVSPDTIVPGVESGKGGAAASVGAYQNHKLTVDYYEPNFISAVQKEHDLVLEKGFWFQLSGQERREVKDPWGPLNPQTLNRYAYVLNNPLRYVDPTGHDVGEFIQDYITDPIKRGWDTWSSWWNDPDFQDALATAPLPMGGVRKIPLGIGGRAGAVRGGARVAQVSRLFRGQVLARAMKVKVPYVGSTDIDLVLTGKRFVEVGGPSKGLTNDQLSKFGSQLTVLREYARQQGGEAYFYYARGTPQQVIEQAKRFLGPDNVLPIP